MRQVMEALKNWFTSHHWEGAGGSRSAPGPSTAAKANAREGRCSYGADRGWRAHRALGVDRSTHKAAARLGVFAAVTEEVAHDRGDLLLNFWVEGHGEENVHGHCREHVPD